MTPKLRVLISSDNAYPPTTPCPVNSLKPTRIDTEGFSGDIWVFIRGYNGELKGGEGEGYFGVRGREAMSYGIVVRGKYKTPFNADNLVFGNVFEKPIRDNLPWGTSIATKFMYFVDPTVEADIYADKPWALSPALATMAHLSLVSNPEEKGKEGQGKPYIDERSLGWLEENVDGDEADDIPPYTDNDEKSHISLRRKWLTKASNRRAVQVDESTEVGMEFCNGLLDFNTLSATLPKPFTLQIPLLKYWDGQPVTYICQDKPPAGVSPVGGENRVRWSVAFEIVDEGAREELKRKGGEVVGPGGVVEEDEKDEKEEGEGNNDDVD
ncbi:hypothetical protein I302_106321 [Kwoniella bestiolae CBS 10118]|uniref:Domain of unknown function at the cortex 1 domain-containing protein n=1 Tax=Kwoniella bestiolae CBS 10118 TaxID=1296100 RepID=A0A1B9G3M1_9TREE|nr:hypothetical protein I302_05445 [Kwoniella bestiolae CBS 10118]OCF25624.1 hypothetical protein I302_05445 [Kwoniella bestiolae CBS 10118]